MNAVAEATRVPSASSTLAAGRGRLPFPDLDTKSTSYPRWPSRLNATSPLRYLYGACKLTLEQENAIRALAGTKSLHSLAVDFGASHETIRAVLRQAAAV